MRSAIVVLIILGLVSSCTKSGAVKGIGVGAGMMILGGVLIATEPHPSDNLNFTGQELAGGAIMLGGFAVGSVSLLALIVFALAGEPSSWSPGGVASPSPSPPPSPPPDQGSPTEHCGVDGNCVPIKPGP